MRLSLSVPTLLTLLSASAFARAQTPPASPPASTGEGEWAARVAENREASTVSGATGVLRVASARSAPVGTLRIGLLADWFSSSGFLCNSSTPCRSGASDSASHVGTVMGASATVASFLEAYGSLRSYTNSNDQGHPTLIQVVGDATLGAKIFMPSSPGQMLHFGGDLQLLLVNGTGLGLASKGTSARARFDATADLRETGGKLPAFVHLNVGYKLDNSGEVVAATEATRGRPVDRVERFGLSTNRVDLLELGVAAEGTFPLDGVVRELRPFVEYTLDVPMNRQGYACVPSKSSPGDLCLGSNSGLSVAPSRATVGVRAWAFTSGLSLTLAGDLGVTGTTKFVEEVAPQAPWTAWFGVAYAVDAVDRPSVTRVQTVERVVTQAPPPSYDVRGVVHGEGAAPISGAQVTFDGRNVPGMITDAQGTFVTTELAPGAYTFSVRADGFLPGQCVATIEAAAGPPADGAASARRSTSVDCPLASAPKLGIVTGSLSAEGGASLSGATVVLVDAAGTEMRATVDGSTFKLDKVPPGKVTLTVNKEGFLIARATADVKPRESTAVSIALRAVPKPPRVVVGKTDVSVRAPIRFDGRTATLKPESTAILEELADTLVRSNKGVEIQAHVDSLSGAEPDRQLTEQRAGAVRDRLVSLGVSAAKIRTKGLGGAQPVVPNITAGNRARNQRIVFALVE